VQSVAGRCRRDSQDCRFRRWATSGWIEAAVSAAGGDVVLVEGLRASGADGSIDERELLVDAEGSAGHGADGVAGREVGEQLAAVVVHASACANDNGVMVASGRPSSADTRPDAPLTAC